MTPATLADRMEARAARYRARASKAGVSPLDAAQLTGSAIALEVLAQEIRTGLFEETEA